MSDVSARYFDGQSARQTDVDVQIGADALVVRDHQGSVLAIWPVDEVRLLGKPERGRPLRLARDKGAARLVVVEVSRLGEFERACPQLHKTRPGAREVWRPIAIWTSLAVAVVVALLWVVIPYAAREAAAAMPPELEVKFGDAAAEQVVRLFSRKEDSRYCSTPEGDRALAALAERFTAHAALPFPLRVRVVRSPIVNAFALPGGQIMLFGELIDFAESPEEVAGVLAHEVGHVLNRHPMEVFVKNVGAATLIGFLLGDITGGSIVGALAQLTVTSAYTREAEREADAEAVSLLNDANIDGSGLVDFFDRLRDMYGSDLDDILAIIGTHPSSADRSDFVRDRVTGTGAALSDAQWHALKGICETD